MPELNTGLQGCSTHCRTLPVVLDGQVIAPSRSFPVTASTMRKMAVGEAIVFPEYIIPERQHLFELPGDRCFRKHRIFWAGMLKYAWVRVE